MRIGLRVDVDTFRGTRLGVPKLCRLLTEKEVLATFFFTVGPDNMGRHLWRLANPSFLWKMLRSNAPGLYGWDIVLRGTLWPGPRIGEQLSPIIRRTADAGHEIGFHAWDHHAWQAGIEHWDEDAVFAQYHQGITIMSEILEQPPTCSAAPAWRCSEVALRVKERFPFHFNSDCRGESIFVPRPSHGDRPLRQPQIPVTLPTYDEVAGRDGVSGSDYYQLLLSLLQPSQLNVLAIHAEVEGLSRLRDFERFMTRAHRRGWSFVPLGDLLTDELAPLTGHISKGFIAGRAGWVSCQDGAAACR